MRRFAVVLLIAVLVVGASAQGSEHPANVHWEEFLPALPSPTEIQPRSVPQLPARDGCGASTCEIRRLRARQRQWGCDHRAVFATTYLELTKALRAGPARAARTSCATRSTSTSRTRCSRTSTSTRSATPAAASRCREAWQIAFEAAKSKDLNAAQDMLLGINAHVQNDMPFVLAALGPAHARRRLAQAGPRRDQRGARPLVRERRARGARPVRSAGRPHEQRRDARSTTSPASSW